ncbi:MAG TPA: long-chain fatty acid--CoA ligase [Kofleriaceae bacterium]|jgi:long-subunit acyl-CoA synthetase (AMP-forming)|nr:long-chain fatty acid--CoA ligase [Kofleriaceae bacterium]
MEDITLPEGTPAALREPTFCAAFQTTVVERGDTAALRTRGDATRFTWRDYGDRVRRYASGLAGLGVRGGDTLAMLLINRPEFNIIDTAAIHLGAVPFSIYVTSTVEQIRYLLADAGARVAVTERAFLPHLRDAAAGTAVRTIVVVDGDGDGDGTLTLAELERAAPAGFDFEATWRAVSPDALLTIIYTSGTTGAPKGVELTHANMLFELRSLHVAGGLQADGHVISYLPHAHIADRTGTHYIPMVIGTTVTTCPDPRQLFEHVLEVHPTQFTGVPRVWEKLKAGLEARFAAEPPDKRAVIEGAIAAGLTRVRAEQAGQPVPAALAAGLARAEALVFAPLRAALGLDRAQYFFVGAAPTPREVLEFFHAINIPIAEVWGMSELSCVATAMPPDRVKIGTVGKSVPGVELRLAADGEVLVRGPLVMRGYRNKPEQTRETIDADGWLATGDVGELDDEGFLRIVDRKKELIINASGKNMSPANIEARIKTSSPLIGQACVIGDGRPYNVALLVLDPDGTLAFCRTHGLDLPRARLVDHEVIRAEIDRAIAAANDHLSRVEQIKRYALLPDEWLPGGDELTPTMKLRRKPIAAKYAAQIDALYVR